MFLTHFLDISQKLEKLVKNVKKSGLERSADPFFSIFWHFWTPPGVPPRTPPEPRFLGFLSKNGKKRGFWTPPRTPPKMTQNTRFWGVWQTPKNQMIGRTALFTCPTPHIISKHFAPWLVLHRSPFCRTPYSEKSVFISCVPKISIFHSKWPFPRGRSV